MQRQIHTRALRGFTLIELLIVIGIIAILVGILLPVVAAVRRKAQAADTAAEISKLGVAIKNYYQDYRAYPGPVPDAQIYGFNSNTSAQVTNITNITFLTSSENLVLGLLGGIAPPTTVGQMCTYPTYKAGGIPLVGNGPQSLNPQSPTKGTAYMDVNLTTELSTIPVGTNIDFTSWTVILTQQQKGQSGPSTYLGGNLPVLNVPEFLDHFSNPHPIIYLRAQTGARGSVVDNTGGNGQAPSQYYSYEMAPYWYGAGTATNATVAPTYGTTGMFPSMPDANNSGGQLYTSALTLFQSQTLPGVAKAQDDFILMSAGYDGIFGTSDDIVYPPQ